MSKKTWINSIITELSLFANPSKEFVNYELNKMYEYYSNYLEFASVALYDDANFEDFLMEGYAKRFGVPEQTINKLKQLYDQLDVFYGACKGLRDFEVIRRKEWDNIIPLARICLEELTTINTCLVVKQ